MERFGLGALTRRLAAMGLATLPASKLVLGAETATGARKVELTAADGHRFTAWRAEATKAKGGIVVLHAVYGLTDHIGDVCTRWAEAGYTAVAPALFDRLGRDLVFPYTAPAEGGKRYAALTEAQILADITAAAAAAGSPGRVAISGFCSGGTWAWRAGAKLDFPAQVNFYGSDIPALNDLMPRCPTVLHYGDKDTIVPMDRVEAIRARHPEVEMHVYPGAGHAFMNPAQATHNAEAAALCWQRSIAFMDRHVASRG